jgi:hypothetical protein
VVGLPQSPPPRSAAGRRAARATLTARLLALSTAAAVLYAHSYGACDAVAVFTPGGKPQVAAVYRGGILLVFTDVPFTQRGMSWEFGVATPDQYERCREVMDASATTTNKARFGFGYAVGDLRPQYNWKPPGFRFVAVRAPAWLVVAPLALLSVRRLAVPLRRRLRGRRGLCPSCGYDLRGSGSARCPECGDVSAVTTPLGPRPRGFAGV